MKKEVKAISIGIGITAIFMFILLSLFPKTFLSITKTNILYDCSYWYSYNEGYLYWVVNSKGEEIQIKQDKVFVIKDEELKDNYIYEYLKEITNTSLFQNAKIVDYEFYIVDY